MVGGHCVAERHWFTTLLCYAPQQIFVIPTGLLLAGSLLAREWRLVVWNGALALLCVFTVLGLRLGPGAVAGGGAVRIVSLNVHHASKGAKGIAGFVKGVDADVVLMQEANAYRQWPDPVPELTSLLPDYAVVRFDEVAVFSRLPIRHWAVRRLRPEGARRAALEAELAVGSRTIRVLNVHFMTSAGADNLLGSRKSLVAYLGHTTGIRSAQMSGVLDWLGEGGAPAVVAGDFNTPPHGALYRLLRRAGLTDCFAAAGRGFGWTYRADVPVLRIDMAFAGEGIIVKGAHTPAVHFSDHRPVVVDLALETEK